MTTTIMSYEEYRKTLRLQREIGVLELRECEDRSLIQLEENSEHTYKLVRRKVIVQGLLYDEVRRAVEHQQLRALILKAAEEAKNAAKETETRGVAVDEGGSNEGVTAAAAVEQRQDAEGIGTKIPELQPCKECPRAREVTFREVRLESLQPLTLLKGLSKINLSQSVAADLTPLLQCANLEEVIFSQTNVPEHDEVAQKLIARGVRVMWR